MGKTNTEEEKKKKKSKWLILLLLLIIIILVIVIVFLLKKKPKEEKLPERNVIINEGDIGLADNLMDAEKVPVGRYEVMMNTTWNFSKGDAASEDAYVGNVERNTNAVYFDLVRSDNEEVILASPIIPVGSRMDKITLDKVLPKGKYDCICTYHLVDDNNEPIGKINVSVTVNVLS